VLLPAFEDGDPELPLPLCCYEQLLAAMGCRGYGAKARSLPMLPAMCQYRFMSSPDVTHAIPCGGVLECYHVQVG
jgi:hypothetical protein